MLRAGDEEMEIEITCDYLKQHPLKYNIKALLHKILICTSLKRCSECGRLIHRGDIYLYRYSSSGPKPICLNCMKTLYPEYEKILDIAIYIKYYKPYLRWCLK